MAKFVTVGLLVLLVVALPLEGRAQDIDRARVDALIGKYAGTIQVMGTESVAHSYLVEIASENQEENTLSLTAYCKDCAQPNLKKDCKITDASKDIEFVCYGGKQDEKYIFDGKVLKGSGFGNKYPYSINVMKGAIRDNWLK